MARPVRILELRSVRGPGGGPEKTILQGAARTDASRFAVTVCYLRDARDTAFTIDFQARALGVDYVEVLEKHSWDISVWNALRRLILTRRIDIVHAHEYKTNLLAWLLAWCEPVLPLATVHGWTGNSTRERLYYAVDKRLLTRFPKLIAVSGEIQDVLVRSGARPQRVTTILNGIDPERFRRQPGRTTTVRSSLGLAPEDVVIGSVGRLEVQKRFDLLVEAFALLRIKRPALRLVIAGEGSTRTLIEEKAARLGASAACRLLGQRADIADLHHAFDLFVQSSDYEGSSNAVLEAMAMETPIVATDVGGTRELVRPGIDGLIVPPGRADLLAQAIDQALTDLDKTRLRRQSARQRVETDLSFDNRQRRLEWIYEKLMDTKERSPRLRSGVIRP